MKNFVDDQLIVDPKTGKLMPHPESPDMPLIDILRLDVTGNRQWAVGNKKRGIYPYSQYKDKMDVMEIEKKRVKFDQTFLKFSVKCFDRTFLKFVRR